MVRSLPSGDTTKRDVYTLVFERAPDHGNRLRLEVLPDERLPAGGPGRTFYEGPKGEFFLSELTLKVGRPIREIRSSSEGVAKDTGAAKLAIDGNPLTGWTTGGRIGKPKQAVFNLEKPLPKGPATTGTRLRTLLRLEPGTVPHFVHCGNRHGQSKGAPLAKSRTPWPYPRRSEVPSSSRFS